MGNRLIRIRRNKGVKKYDDNLDLFLKSVKYFDKLVFYRPCIYKLEFYKNRTYSYEFDNLNDAIRFLLSYRKKFIRLGFIELFVIFTDHNVFDMSIVNNANDNDVLFVKNIFEKDAGSCVIQLSKDLSQVYAVHYYSDKDFSGYRFSYDMKYLYDKDNCIDIKPYMAYMTDVGYGDVYKYNNYKTDIKIPWFITAKELYQKQDLLHKYNCPGYGVGGSFQIICIDGCIYTDDTRSAPYNMMPIAAIHEYQDKRPNIDGVTRYKFIIKLPNGDEYPHYVECETGNMIKAMDLLAKYDWIYPEVKANPKDFIKSIEAVPAGEWF